MEHTTEDHITDDDYLPLPGSPLRKLIDECQKDMASYKMDAPDILLDDAAMSLILGRLDAYEREDSIVAKSELVTAIGWFVVHTASDYAKRYYND